MTFQIDGEFNQKRKPLFSEFQIILDSFKEHGSCSGTQ